MKSNIDQLHRIVLTMSTTMLIMCIIVFPMLQKDSGEFVITTISIFVNLFLILGIIIRLKVIKRKQEK